MGSAPRACFLALTLAVTVLAAPALAQQSLQFDGVNDYVTFGVAPSLGVSTFTIEVRFLRTGAGVTTSTGTGGVTAAVPLLTKGRGEADGDNRDMNYFLGINASNQLVADFEEGAGAVNPGLNHPAIGATAITNNVWHHAAATFDGVVLWLYLDGALEDTVVVGAGRLPRSDSIQHAALGSALTSAPAAAGFFLGRLDEARVWNVARSQAQIQASMSLEVLEGSGLVGRWGLNEGSGTSAGNSVASGVNGTLTNGPTWSTDSTVPLTASTGLRFGGTNAYASFGSPTALQLSAFTIEMWIRRDGDGVGTNTGTGGIPDAIPLFAKGRAEAENSSADINYLFGIRASDKVLCADFEEAATGTAPGLNHPVAGTTPITTGAWHHVAATYDGTTWKLYLDGVLEASLTVGQPVNAACTSAAALASALTTGGAAAGFFDGAVDEVRIWNLARADAEIISTINAQLAGPTSGLVARWGLDEDAGLTLASSAGTTLNGTLTGSGWSWGAPSPFNAVVPTTYTLATSVDPPGTGTVTRSPNQTAYLAGASVQLTAVPTAGSLFASWSGDLSGTSNPQSITMSANRNVVANFTPPDYDALLLSGTDGWVNFGNPSALKLDQFTIEMWMRRDGAGVGTNTGSGGISDMVPLFSKGRADTEDPLRDINYILGIRASSGVLAADFEEAAAPSPDPSLNHPVIGTSPLAIGTWYHVAATYDGTTWKLYVNGSLDAQLAVGRAVASTSDCPVALGSALTTVVPAAGFFQGALDEVRVWNVARTGDQIRTNLNDEMVSPVAGLVARWSLDEGTGTLVQSTAGTPLDGTVTGTGYGWTDAAPFNAVPPTPPAAPSNFTVEAVSHQRIDLTWTDGSSNETGFEIYRSSSGVSGTYALIDTTAANATTFSDTGLSSNTEYCYRIRAINGVGASAYDGPECTTTDATPSFALAFSGNSTYASFGDPAALDLAEFTIETWFRRDGAGTTAETGSGGVPDAIPLVTHGSAQTDGSNLDMNFYLGIKEDGDVLCADFEEGAAGTTPGLNHPILGTTSIANGVWHHAAVTYDGSEWKLYLDGNLENSFVVGQPVQSASIQLAALASSIQSDGTAQGFFVGALDEVRIWNHARTQVQIQGTANAKIDLATTGLVARWGLDEGAGTAVTGSAGTTVSGSITGASYAWVAGAPFNLAFNMPPTQPALVTPANQATGVALPTLRVTVSDADANPLTVTFYGRSAVANPGQDFTIVGLPDTQYYTGQLNGGLPAMLNSQTGWIVSNVALRDIAYAATLGDCVEHGDNGGDDIEWQRADAGYSLIENPGTTGLPEGVPYGITVGNHDQSPNGNPDGTTLFYNQYFGESRFTGRAYYGGHYGSNNDNWYNLFTAGGMDFIVISFEYDTTPDAAVLAWADGLLTTYASRRAIILSHNLAGTGNPAAFSAQGQGTYDALKSHSNLFLMLCGHVAGEGRRSDTFNGNTVYTLMSDYQARTNGGNGWLRILTFSPANNVIHVQTYSPWLDQFETDADSQFDLTYSMSSADPYTLLATFPGIASGSPATFLWPGRDPSTPYEWYVTVSDGIATTTGPTWSFTTGTVVTGVEQEAVSEFSLRLASRNPTSGAAAVSFVLPQESAVRVEIFDVNGRLVETLANGTYPKGRHTARWSGRTPHGEAPSGVYFLKFRSSGHEQTRRIVVVR